MFGLVGEGALSAISEGGKNDVDVPIGWQAQTNTPRGYWRSRRAIGRNIDNTAKGQTVWAYVLREKELASCDSPGKGERQGQAPLGCQAVDRFRVWVKRPGCMLCLISRHRVGLFLILAFLAFHSNLIVLWTSVSARNAGAEPLSPMFPCQFRSPQTLLPRVFWSNYWAPSPTSDPAITRCSRSPTQS